MGYGHETLLQDFFFDHVPDMAHSELRSEERCMINHTSRVSNLANGLWTKKKNVLI